MTQSLCAPCLLTVLRAVCLLGSFTLRHRGEVLPHRRGRSLEDITERTFRSSLSCKLSSGSSMRGQREKAGKEREADGSVLLRAIGCELSTRGEYEVEQEERSGKLC